MTTNATCLVTSIQFAPLPHQPKKNLAKATQLVHEAAIKGAKIIVLPELCMSGRNLNTIREACNVAQEKNGYQTKALHEIALANNCFIVFGFVELCEGKLHNSAGIIGPAGLVGIGRKHNLDGNDYLWADMAENLHPIVPTPWGRIGILIGRDIINEERASQPFRVKQPFYRKGSLDVLCLLSNSSSDVGYPASPWMELCEGLGTNVIVSNELGLDKGGSCIIDREQNVHTFGSSFAETAVVGGYIVTG